MNQLRTSELFRYRQSYQTHKQKIKHIMNRSTQSIKYLSEKQSKLSHSTRRSHQKAFKFKINESSRHINKVNELFVNKIIDQDQRRTLQKKKQMNNSYIQGLRAKQNFMRTSSQTSSSRIQLIQKNNSLIAKRISSVRSTISARDFNRDYNEHAQRSSMLSRFKIDASNFKFIPKNQILLNRISKVRQNLSKSTSTKVLPNKLSESKISSGKLPEYSKNLKASAKNSLMKLSSPQQKAQFKNFKLQKLNSRQNSVKPKISVSINSLNPQRFEQMSKKLSYKKF